ncbi:putative glycoside hydrolase [Pontiellaceae bacterium B12219]|nr:putative glycoside hydrolase [Pontiellaceae bacterium B12219]
MKTILSVICLGVCCSLSAKEVYVSPEGHAQADGSIEKPYATLPGAVAAVRALRASGYTEPVSILLREGRHSLKETLVLGLADGNPAAPMQTALPMYGAGEIADSTYLTIAAYPGEQPVISAGVPVTGWQRLEMAPPELPEEAAGKVWVADMPEGMGRFYTLYDGNGRLKRARDSGFTVTEPGDLRTLHFPKGALKNWDNVEDVEINIRPSRAWVINMLPLASVNEETGVAKTGVSATYAMGPIPGWVHNPSGNHVWVENMLEALNEPGEWVVNTKTRKIYLWPRDPQTDGSPRGILAPSTSELIRVEGQIDYDGPTDVPVVGIAFEGLTFTHGDRRAWTSDETRLGWGIQHDWDLFDRPSAMLRFRGAEACVVKACRFVDAGGTGIRLDLHAQRNRIEDCEFAHLGEAGILLTGYGPGTKDVNHHNTISNNHIHHFSEITWHSPGIWAWQSGHNEMVHNELHHSGYAAVMITTRVPPDRGLNSEGGRTVRQHEIPAEDKEGVVRSYENWKAREKYNHSRNNLFEYNEISHTVQLLSDGNAVYVSGTGGGNIIRYNYIHDNLEHSFPSAIRCDDDQHETLIYGNVLVNNYGFSAGIASKGVNDIINNFIVNPLTAPNWGYISLEWYPVTGSKIQRNVIIAHSDGGNAQAQRPIHPSKQGPLGKPELKTTNMDSNLYYHASSPAWMDEHLEMMQSAGLERSSLVGDPLFVDPDNGDFSFHLGSPFVPQKNFPKFSWDTTPMYYMFGEMARVLHPEEMAFIAERTDFLCIEKSHGLKQLGAAELGAKHDAAAFKQIKPDMKVLFYFNSAYAWPFTSYNKMFRGGMIDQYPELKKFLIVDPETGELEHRNKVFFFDVLNPDLREWWVNTVAKGVTESGCDGAFIDQMHGFSWLRKDRSAEVELAMGEMMAALKEKMGPDKILLANNAHQDIAKHVFPVMDASMFEHYKGELLSKESLLRDWNDMLRIARAGKMSIFRIGVEVDRSRGRKSSVDERAELARERLEYYLACYLIGAQPYFYFQYGWGWKLGDGSLYDYPELQKPLGEPKGPYRRITPDGWEFTREFEHAEVWVDTDKGEARITWR